MNVGDMQRKLSLWAEEDKEHRFFDLYHLLYDPDWLLLAHDHVKANAGSQTAGCDGIRMGDFDRELEGNLRHLAEELKQERFEPHPVRRVTIPKGNGKTRPLGIATVRDRIVQEAVRMILEPIFEADFCQRSFGFRPGRRAQDAVAYVTVNTIGHKRYYWIIEGDIASYFDTVHHRKLMKLLGRRVRDRKLLDLIWKFLRAGVMDRGLFRDTTRGVPQGGIVSPLLANVYLHELDLYLEQYARLTGWARARRRKQGQSNFLYVRYADDFLVMCDGTKAQAEAMKEELAEFLSKRLRLELSKEKTQVTHLNDGVDFLGFHIERRRVSDGMKLYVLIPKQAVERVIEKIKRATTRESHGDATNAKILALNRIVGGWCRYYQHVSGTSRTFTKVSQVLYWRMAHWLGRKYKLRMSQVLARYQRDSTFATSEYRLVKPQKDFPTIRYKQALFKPNPYTMREVALERERFPEEEAWTGYEKRPGMADLQPLVLERDAYQCQMCGSAVSVATAQVDHLKPVRRFKRPLDANRLENLWTLCIECHKEKTQIDRRMESRVH